MIVTVTFLLIAYLLGSISSAILVCRLWGLPDPRTQGSNNPGATNVLRMGGKIPAVLTLLGDALKGTLPVLLGQWFGLNTTVLALVALAAFLGHLFPLFFRFQGGKGVATALGCLLALAYPIALLSITTWVLITLLFRYVSLASMIVAITTPFYLFLFGYPTSYILVTSIMAALLIYRHSSNIVKLFSGQESKLGQRLK